MIDVGEAMNEGVVLAILLAVMITDGVLTKFLDFATLSFEVSQQNLSLYLEIFSISYGLCDCWLENRLSARLTR